jgi:hypothetical protein
MRRFALHKSLVGLAAIVGPFAGLMLSAAPASANEGPPPGGGDNSGVQVINVKVDGSVRLNVVSCPTPTWCAAGAADGKVVVYNTGTWSKPKRVFPVGDSVDGISCPTTTFCMAVSYLGGYSTLSKGAWSAPATLGGQIGLGVSCSTSTFCMVETDAWGNLEVWQKGSWSASFDGFDDAHGGLGQTSGPVSCVPGSTKSCMYADNVDYYTAYSGSWTKMTRIPSGAGSAGVVTCSNEPTAGVWQGRGIYPVGSTPLCTVVDSTGSAYSRHGSTWSAAGKIDKTATFPGLTGASCVYARCAAVDGSGNVLYENLFSGWSGSWSAPYSLGVKGLPTAISCASLSFCVAVTSSSEAAILDPSL